jgi:cobalt/nickel transport system permease protein
VISALLGFAFVFCLLYGYLSLPVLVVFSAGLAVFVFITSLHRHPGFIPIDVIAQSSRLKTVNTMLKIITLSVLMVISVASGKALPGLFLTGAMLILAVSVGGIRVHEYMQLIMLPMTFLLISGLALLFEVHAEPVGVINLNASLFYLSVTADSQIRTMLIIARAMGALSCLMMIGVSTPIPDIIGVMRRLYCPRLIIDLSYLIYRYVFILLGLHHEMHDAAKSRLGMKDHPTALRTTARIYSNLLARSHQQASVNYDAMESRCFESGIRFLERQNKAVFPHVFISLSLLAVVAGISLLPV